MDILMVDDAGRSDEQVLDDADLGCKIGRFGVEMCGSGLDAVLEPFEQRLVVGEAPEEGLEQMRVSVPFQASQPCPSSLCCFRLSR